MKQLVTIEYKCGSEWSVNLTFLYFPKLRQGMISTDEIVRPEPASSLSVLVLSLCTLCTTDTIWTDMGTYSKHS